jgi:hypothetical protein
LSEYSRENSEKASFQLDATAKHGDAVNDYGSLIVREASSRSATLRGKVGGGPKIKVTSQRGWISVRKEDTLPSEVLSDTPRGKPPKTLRDFRKNEVKM